MITLVVGGLALLVVIAVAAGVLDAARAPAERRTAAERRRRWEQRQLEFHGIDGTGTAAED